MPSCAAQFGIDVDRPLICQVSRFDPWKDPLGVIDAYRQVKETMPDVQLALVGSMASDDPEGWDFFNAHDRPCRRRPRRPHPQQLQQRRGDRGQRLPIARRRADPEVHPRGLRADGLGGDLEGASVHRRQRRRHPAADRGRRHRLSRLQRRAVRRAHPGDPARPRARQPARPTGQGARPPALPHAALSARLPADLQRAARKHERVAGTADSAACW